MNFNNKWSEDELEILINNFSSIKWDVLLQLLPTKGEGSITSKAADLGLKRESEKIAEYYDEERDAWVVTTVNYNKIKVTVSSIYPAKGGSSFEEAKDRVVNNIAKSIYNISKPKYQEFLWEIGKGFHTKKLGDIFHKLQLNMFFRDDEQVQSCKEQLFAEIKRRLDE
ncbi:hypothetical protein [Bacillus infantis]|uniref:hypothetical protein n=1 Tax=Bacillus infantis TaxID=324767 RepID=UPI003CE80E37